MRMTVVVIALGACGGGKTDKPAPAPPPQPPARAKFPTPAERVDVHALLGAPRAELDRRFPKSEKMDDGSIAYGVGGDPTGLVLDVAFEQGRTLSVLIEGHREMATPEDRDDVMAWANVSPANDDIDPSMVPAGFSVWAVGGRARTEARRALAQQLTEAERSEHRQASITAGTRLTVTNTDATTKCDEKELRAVASKAAKIGLDLKTAGFDSMECMGGVDETAVVEL